MSRVLMALFWRSFMKKARTLGGSSRSSTFARKHMTADGPFLSNPRSHHHCRNAWRLNVLIPGDPRQEFHAMSVGLS